MTSLTPGTISATLSSSGLTERELDVLGELVLGKTSKEVAVTLRITISTVATHRKNICRKLNVHSTVELVCRVMSFASTDPATKA